MTMVQHAQLMKTSGDDDDQDIDWATIEAAVRAAKPACAAWIPKISAYVKQNAGGADGTLISELGDYMKAFGGKGSQRMLGGDCLARVTGLSFGPGRQCPYIRHALLEAQLASQPNKVSHSICQLITPTALHELTKKNNRGFLDECEKMMTASRTLCAWSNMSVSARVKCIGLYDVRLVLHVMKKWREFDATQFPDLASISKACRA